MDYIHGNLLSTSALFKCLLPYRKRPEDIFIHTRLGEHEERATENIYSEPAVNKSELLEYPEFENKWHAYENNSSSTSSQNGYPPPSPPHSPPYPPPPPPAHINKSYLTVPEFVDINLSSDTQSLKSKGPPAEKECEAASYNKKSKAMTRVENEDEIDDDSETIPFYEKYWAENTTAHGVSRVANTTKWHRAVWIAALLGCFVYVSIEIYRSIATYKLHLTTTEINKINSEAIQFPSVTFCNFNRWRQSKMTDEVKEQLMERLSLYSYDYVIPDLNDGEIDPDTVDVQQFVDIRTTTPKPTTTTTTEPPPVRCRSPEPPLGMVFDVISGSNESLPIDYPVNTTIRFLCLLANQEPMDGDVEQVCGDSGEFEGRMPLCVDIGDLGERYTLSNSPTDDEALAVSTQFSSFNKEVEAMTLCFWIRTAKGDNLGTILSYGVNNAETILSVIKTTQAQSSNIYGVKYKLFGTEGRAITLTSYDQWNPFCLQYSSVAATSQSLVQLYKFLVYSGSENLFTLYGEDTVLSTRPFPVSGTLVLFNEYGNLQNQEQGRPFTAPSSGGQLANVNMWSRIIPVEVMNAMLWRGDLFSMSPELITILSGNILTDTYTFNVSVSQNVTLKIVEDAETLRVRREVVLENLRHKRQIEENQANSTLLTTTASVEEATTASNGSNSTQDRVEDTLKDVFNYADFTRSAGWQMVDKHSNHSGTEPRTLLKCTFRGKECDSRWFVHRFGAYGNCYTFNQDLTELAEEEGFNHPIIQDNSGPTGGLNVILDIQTWEYAETPSLNGNSELGLKFIVHAPYEVPVINSMGYAVGPGQKAFVGFQKTSIENMYAPWGKCDPEKKLTNYANYTFGGCKIECTLNAVVAECGCKPYHFPGDHPVCRFPDLVDCAFLSIENLYAPWGKCDPARKLKYNVNYTVDACGIECKLKRVVEVCQCKPYYFPGDFSICTFEQLQDCAFIEIAKVNADFGNVCDCPIACNSEEFDVKLSYTGFPNSPYGRQLGETLNITIPNISPSVPFYDSKTQYIRSNLVNMDIYFESMAEIFMKQNKAMDDTALLSNIGGQLGLFIGCSFLTAIEFLECLCMSTIYHCKRSGRKRDQRKKEWTANPDASPTYNGEKNYAYHMDEMNTNNHNNNTGANDASADSETQPRVRTLKYGDIQKA